ncbi:MAG: nucleotidyltransferase family protein [Planctomycetaceae bacterium]|nr:nucleotidyltransferase family protein [Planctomycetaceae bacterium]
MFAVVPAAGHSRRMGQPKLLVRIGGESIIRRLVGALQAGGVTSVSVLVREADLDLQAELAGSGARVVLTPDTPDMRASVATLLGVIQQEDAPQPEDSWLLAPADHPFLSAQVVSDLLAARQPGDAGILVPVHAGRRGHPTCFAWGLAARVAAMPAGQGINQLLCDGSVHVREVPTGFADVLTDLDTPDDLERLRQRLESYGEPVCDERDR